MSVRLLILLLATTLFGCGDDSGADTGTDVPARDASEDARGDDASETDTSERSDVPSEDVDAEDRSVDTTPPPEPAPRFVGRFDDSDPDAVRFSWSGSGVIVRFRGTGARISMRGGRYFTHLVDGEQQPTLAVSNDGGTYDLASGLPDGEHTVEIYRRTEGSFGPTIVSGIEVDGEMLAVPMPTRLMEVVGDSITAGYGVDGSDENCNFSAETENHYLTWGAISARALGAELSAVAWSGKGAVYNYGDNRDQPMPELYGRVIATEAGSTGTVRAADVVVINLGTNDYSTGGDPPRSAFVPNYVDLLEQVRGQHPGAKIFCTVAPPLFGDDMREARAAIDEAIAARAATGDDEIQWVDMDGFADWGCDYHPGDETQALLADDLIPVLRAELGW